MCYSQFRLIIGIKMDICIGGILDGQKRKNDHTHFKVDNHYSDHGSQYNKEYFHLDGQLHSFWISEELDFYEAQKRVELILNTKLLVT
ncbi:hypothetical protein D3C80_207080 [compost metagenome]